MRDYEKAVEDELKIDDRVVESLEVLKGMAKDSPEYNAQKQVVFKNMSDLDANSGKKSKYGERLSITEYASEKQADVERLLGINQSAQAMPSRASNFDYGAVAAPLPLPGSGSGSGSGFRFQSMNGARIEGGRTRRSRKHTRKSKRKGKKASRGRR